LISRILFSVISVFIASSFSFAQQDIEKLSEDAAKEYVSPLINAIGSNLNSGWITKAPFLKMHGLDIDFELVGIGTFTDNSPKNFAITGNVMLQESYADRMVANLPPGIREVARDSLMRQLVPVNVSGPTISGSGEIQFTYAGSTMDIIYNNQAYTVHIDSVTETTSVKGLDMGIVPLAAVQLSIGTLAGTKISLRYLPPVNFNSSIGKITSYGFAIQHNPLVWFKKEMPFDLALSYSFNKMSIGDMFKSTASQFGIMAGKTFGADLVSFTPYIALSLESASTDVNYNYSYTDSDGNSYTQRISFTSESANNLRFRLGGALRLSVVTLHADYNFARHNSVSAGLGFSF
jgi:uncharacterized protein DUF6588